MPIDHARRSDDKVNVNGGVNVHVQVKVNGLDHA